MSAAAFDYTTDMMVIIDTTLGTTLTNNNVFRLPVGEAAVAAFIQNGLFATRFADPSTVAPVDTTQIWPDTNSNPTIYRHWDGAAWSQADWYDIWSSASPLTTKGDMYGFSTFDARLPVGADGQVIVADSTENLGVKWDDTPLPFYADRATAIAATISTGVNQISVVAPNGDILKYRRDTTNGTALTTNGGTVDWSPDGIITPDHWGENTTPGTTDMQAAAHSAIDYLEATSGGVLVLRSGIDYYFGSSVPVAASDIKVYAHGASITAAATLGSETQNRPDGVFNFIGTEAASTTLSADVALYAETVSVTSAAGMAVGQVIRFYAATDLWYTENVTTIGRNHVNRIKAISGTTITLDTPVPRAFTASTFTCDVSTWDGLSNVGIEGGSWEGGGFDHNLNNGIGTAAVFFEYVQNAVFKPEFVGGFSGAQMWATMWYGLYAEVPNMRGHVLGYADAIVEGQNSGFYGLRVDDGRSAALYGGVSINIRHTTDGTRAEDVKCDGWSTYNNHRPPHGSHSGCTDWKFTNCNSEGPFGMVLWRGFDAMMDNCSLVSPNSVTPIFYDVVGAVGDLARTYNFSNLKAIVARECLRLEAVIGTCHLTAPDFEGAIESVGFAAITINTPDIEAFICTGGHLRANDANHAVKVASSPNLRDLIQFNGTRFSDYTSAAVQCYAVTDETSLIMQGVTFNDGNSVTDHVDDQGTFDHLDVYGFDYAGAVYALGNQGSYDPVFGDSTIDCTLDAVSEISWTRRGERVWINGEIRLTSTNSVAGNLLLKNLPFPIAPLNRAGAGGLVTWSSGLSLSAASIITLRALASGTEMGFYVAGTAGGTSLASTDITATSRFLIAAQYVTDE